MKRILASMIDLGGITQEHLQHNYRNFVEAKVGWVQTIDVTIFGAIEQHHLQHHELPSGQTLRDHFDDDIEATERLKEVVVAQRYIRTNFRQLVQNLLKDQRRVRAQAALKEANDLFRADDLEGGFRLLKERITAQEASASSSKLRTVGVHAIRAPLPPLVWTCEALRLAPGGVTLWAGFGDSAKSMFCQYLVLCAASGRPVFGTLPVQQGNVLHLDYEQGERASYERYQRLANGMGLDLSTLPDDALRLAIFPDVYLDDKQAEDVLRSTIEQHRSDIIIFDSFKAGTPDTEENSSAARKPLDMLNRVCGPARTAFGIHHSRKPPQEKAKGAVDPRMSIRGAGAIYDAVQGAFVFDRDREDQDSPIKIYHVKERLRGRRLDTFGFRVVDVVNPNDPADTHWGLRVEYVPPEEMQAAAPAPNRDPKFAAQCQAMFARILAIGATGITRSALKDTGLFGGDATVGRLVSHLVETDHVIAREVTTGPSRSRGTYYSAATGKTSYAAPAQAVGLGVEDLTAADEDLLANV